MLLNHMRFANRLTVMGFLAFKSPQMFQGKSETL